MTVCQTSIISWCSNEVALAASWLSTVLIQQLTAGRGRNLLTSQWPESGSQTRIIFYEWASPWLCRPELERLSRSHRGQPRVNHSYRHGLRVNNSIAMIGLGYCCWCCRHFCTLVVQQHKLQNGHGRVRYQYGKVDTWPAGGRATERPSLLLLGSINWLISMLWKLTTEKSPLPTVDNFSCQPTDLIRIHHLSPPSITVRGECVVFTISVQWQYDDRSWAVQKSQF